MVDPVGFLATSEDTIKFVGLVHAVRCAPSIGDGLDPCSRGATVDTSCVIERSSHNAMEGGLLRMVVRWLRWF